MSVVIVGGNECMVCQYEKICREYGCKAKVLVKEKGNIKKKLGNPDSNDFIYQYGVSQDG